MDDRLGNPSGWVFSFAEQHPAAYRRGVQLFGMLGYVYLAGVAFLVAATTACLTLVLVRTGIGPLALRVSLPALLLALLARSAVSSPVDPDEGLVVTRREAPLLHAVIESVRSRLAAPPFRSVLIGAGFEIRVVRLPRLGSLLGFHNHLVLGLPLLVSLPLSQFRALLAHELAHFSRDRGIDGVRIYRLRDRWLQLAAGLRPGRHPAVVLMRAFFQWYAPRFAAFSLPLARKHEHAADRVAMSASGRTDFTLALVRAGVVERFLIERFYPLLLADLRRYGVAPSGLQGRLDRALSEIRDDRRFMTWLDAALSREEATGSHPCVRSRLAALGVREDAQPGHGFHAAFAGELNGESAARHMLGTASAGVTLSIEHAWIEDVLQSWAGRREELQRWDQRRRQLDERNDLSPGETLDHAIATAEIQGTDAALPILRDLVSRQPEMAPARFVLGTLLLRRNEEQGLEHIEAAMMLDRDLAADGCELAAAFFRANGRHDDATAFLSRFGLASEPETHTEVADAATDISGPAPAEPAAPRPGSSGSGYDPHGLDGPALLAAKRQVAPVAAIARAFLVREAGARQIRSAAAVSVPVANGARDEVDSGSRFLLAVELMRGNHDPQTVALRLAGTVKLPGPAVVAVLTRRNRSLRRALSGVRDALLFQRTRRRAA